MREYICTRSNGVWETDFTIGKIYTQGDEGSLVGDTDYVWHEPMVIEFSTSERRGVKLEELET